jgi:hypothetical protein
LFTEESGAAGKCWWLFFWEFGSADFILFIMGNYARIPGMVLKTIIFCKGNYARVPLFRFSVVLSPASG